MLRSVKLSACLLSISTTLLMSGCNNDADDPKPTDTFNKEAMLEQLAEGVILPAYGSFNTASQNLHDASLSFQINPTEENLEKVRNAFKQAQLSWQGCAMFEFGPAADQNLRQLINTFPTDTAQIEKNINDQNVNLDLAINTDAKGLPAIDYLLFGSEAALVNWNADRINQLLANTGLIKDAINTVLNKWDEGYQVDFTQNIGNDVGSSLGQWVNELNFEFELVKNARVGIPLGKKSLGIAQPEKVEALYSEMSLESINAALVAQKKAFQGGGGLGLDDYLDHLDAQYNDEPLSTAIETLFDEALAKNEAISPTLNSAILASPGSVEELHTTLQNLVVLLKTDMPSYLGVQITYQSNDGD